MPLRHRLLLGYFVICTLGLVWPAYARIGNRIRPFVLGIPMSFAWVIGWVLLTFVVLLTYHATGREEG